MTDEPKLTEAQREALADALHDDIDGDFLVGADGYGEDIAMQHAGAADVVRWAVNATGPVVARMVAAAEKAARAEAWDEGYQRGLRDELQDVTHGADNPYRSTP